ncbi:helix-hairpin-helix domain-containing protein [Undibacterium luofuense]|uniref:Helix-hairpin-helix domain-containing protein n=1 Tax=Undibacterium luofuense TaxID=2828733 RepID=A0A941DKL9_9BURK|nr:helix-hairpin-helix domain-containing protein [Undibacterium luofuense]MBR7780531.1 helix-hairpin-helix domain-containing protein [Undibacterium luofuense]
MHPQKVCREKLEKLTDLPNIGPAAASDLMLLGIQHPSALVGQDAYQLYEELCRLTRQRHDPCVIDVFLSVIRFMEGEPPQSWWAYTAERQQTLLSRTGKQTTP